MDTSVFAFDLPAWFSWASDAVYIASLCVALFAIVLVSCIAAQIMTAESHSDAPKRKTHLAR